MCSHAGFHPLDFRLADEERSKRLLSWCLLPGRERQRARCGISEACTLAQTRTPTRSPYVLSNYRSTNQFRSASHRVCRISRSQRHRFEPAVDPSRLTLCGSPRAEPAPHSCCGVCIDAMLRCQWSPHTDVGRGSATLGRARRARPFVFRSTRCARIVANRGHAHCSYSLWLGAC